MIPIDVKKMSEEELNIFKESISKELELRRKEKINKLINNFEDAWDALKKFGIEVKYEYDTITPEDIFYEGY